MMNLQAYSILIILLIAMVLFIWGRWRFDIVALFALTAGVIVGAVPFNQVFSGLSNNAVITVACVMIISESIAKSGLIDTVIHHLNYLTKSFFLHLTTFCLVTAVLSAFMNNVGALTLIMPVAIQTAIKRKRSPSLFLMPIALSSALGGLITLIGTPPNLLISSFKQTVSGQPFAMFDFSYVGVGVAVVGILFIIFIGWRLIPGNRHSISHSEDKFKMSDYIIETKVTEKSKAIDLTIAEFEKLIKEDYVLLGIIRNKRKKFSLKDNEKLKENDILIIEASKQALELLLKKAKLSLDYNPIKSTSLKNKETNFIEAVVPSLSKLEGRSAESMRLRARHHLNVLAIARRGESFKERLNEVKLKAGDVILLQGAAQTLRAKVAKLGFLPLVERDIKLSHGIKTYLPVLFFTLAIIASALQIIPVQIAFGGVVLLIAVFNLLPIRTMYNTVNWPIIILLAAMIPLGHALETTGGTAMIAGYITAIAGHVSPIVILVIVLLVTMTLSDFMNNAATAVVMAPIAVSIAQGLQVSINPFLMAVAVGASCSFLTPIGHQNNTLVMGPGGYKFTDYIRVGLPLEIVITITAIPLILWAWPFMS